MDLFMRNGMYAGSFACATACTSCYHWLRIGRWTYFSLLSWSRRHDDIGRDGTAVCCVCHQRWWGDVQVAWSRYSTIHQRCMRMNAWMHECMSAWMHECMNAWIYAYMSSIFMYNIPLCMHSDSNIVSFTVKWQNIGQNVVVVFSFMIRLSFRW
jgi:hypothetical protein